MVTFFFTDLIVLIITGKLILQGKTACVQLEGFTLVLAYLCSSTTNYTVKYLYRLDFLSDMNFYVAWLYYVFQLRECLESEVYELFHKKLTEQALIKDPKFLWCCHVSNQSPLLCQLKLCYKNSECPIFKTMEAPIPWEKLYFVVTQRLATNTEQ